MATILIVDPLATSRAAMRLLLEEAGYRVAEAVNGMDAMEKALSFPLSMLFVDINLPKMDGLLLVRQLRQDSAMRNLPIVMMSLAPRPGEREAALRAGANLFRDKPLLQGELIGLARLLVNSFCREMDQGAHC